MLGKEVKFKSYLHGVDDAGNFRFRSGTHEELGRHRSRKGKSECALCCESV